MQTLAGSVGSVTMEMCPQPSVTQHGTVAPQTGRTAPATSGVGSWTFSCYGGVTCWATYIHTEGFAVEKFYGKQIGGPLVQVASATGYCYDPMGCVVNGFWSPPNHLWSGTSALAFGVAPARRCTA